MADLKAAADQFVKDLVAMNIAGLMMCFTPNGMTKAMAMQQQLMAGSGGATLQPATGYEVTLGDPEGDVHPVEIVLQNPQGSATIQTRWQEVAGVWKVEDIGLKG